MKQQWGSTKDFTEAPCSKRKASICSKSKEMHEERNRHFFLNFLFQSSWRASYKPRLIGLDQACTFLQFAKNGTYQPHQWWETGRHQSPSAWWWAAGSWWNLWERLLSTMRWGENDSTHRARTRNGSYNFIHVFRSWTLNVKGRSTILSAHEFMPTYCNKHPRKKRRPKEQKLSRQGMTLTLSFLVSSLFPIEVTDFSCAISWKKQTELSLIRLAWRAVMRSKIRVYLQGCISPHSRSFSRLPMQQLNTLMTQSSFLYDERPRKSLCNDGGRTMDSSRRRHAVGSVMLIMHDGMMGASTWIMCDADVWRGAGKFVTWHVQRTLLPTFDSFDCPTKK